MIKKEGSRYLISFFIFLLAVFLFFKLVSPLINLFLTSVLLTYLVYPIYKNIKKGVVNQFLSIILTLLIALLILLLPFSYLSYKIARQTSEFYSSISTNIGEGQLFGFKCLRENSVICSMINKADDLSARKLSQFDVSGYLRMALSFLVDAASGYLLVIPRAVIGTGMTLFISYFLLRDGQKIMEKVANIIPLGTKTIEKLVAQFRKVTYAIVFSQLLVAIAQGVLSAIGFYLFGIPLPVFWGVVISFLALIPSIGTALVWVPASLFLIISGYVSNDYAVLLKGIGLFAYGVCLISTIDNILRVKIIQAKAEVHPLIVITGVIGGINLFGVTGVFLGPIILSLLVTYFENLKEGFV